MSALFQPLKLREITFRNRIFVSPMCQYSSIDGMPTDWHLVHLGSRAVGGAALVIVEATAVSPEGRISPTDSGLWSDAHAEAFQRITRFIKAQGSAPGVQLAHAGRKASTEAPWEGSGPVRDARAWQTLAPSAIPFHAGDPVPREMNEADIEKVARDFQAATQRAKTAGFEVVELHMAHGYLLHSFLSPLSNHRTDAFGGSLENRMRLPLRIARETRAIWSGPLFVRISASDWAEGGWDLAQSVEFAKRLKEIGIDLIDCSSGGLTADAKIRVEPGYQVPFAEAVRQQAGIATGAVGLITKPEQAERIIAEKKADAVLLAREFLRDPYWPMHAAEQLGAEAHWPKQYGRAKPHKS